MHGCFPAGERISFPECAARTASFYEVKVLIEDGKNYSKYSSVLLISYFAQKKLDEDITYTFMMGDVPVGAFFYRESTDHPGCCVKVIKQAIGGVSQEEGCFFAQEGKFFFRGHEKIAPHEIDKPVLQNGETALCFPAANLKSIPFASTFLFRCELIQKRREGSSS